MRPPPSRRGRGRAAPSLAPPRLAPRLVADALWPLVRDARRLELVGAARGVVVREVALHARVREAELCQPTSRQQLVPSQLSCWTGASYTSGIASVR